MENITVENMIDGRLRGSVLGIPGPLVDQLRAAEAFKPTQGWKMFRRPGMLVRRETLEMGELIERMTAQDPSQRNTIRRILVGEKGSGKSMMLLQSMIMAFLKGWTVIHLPEGKQILLSPHF